VRVRSAAALLGVAALLAFVYAAGVGRKAHVRPTPEAAAAPAAAGAAAPLGALPESLLGTEPDGGLTLGADGRFVPGRDALAFFDYFYAASGEEPDARIQQRIRAQIRSRLPAAAASEAEAFFARYLAYRDGARALFASDAAHLDEERRFQRIRELRREAFGAELAAALFGDEERVVQSDLEARRVAQDESLTPEERAGRIAAIEAELPEAERAAREQARAVVALRQAEAELRASGAGLAEIEALRERRFGAEAAGRLRELDLRRADWNARVAAYRAERDALRAAGLPPERLAAELTQLRDSRFQGAERVRIEALERAEALPPRPDAVATESTP
jgi:lipase chaperone LimK